MDGEGHDPYGAQRRAMVEAQLRGRAIDDERVLGAMAKVPRHCFVPIEQREHAYEDAPLPIGYGQTISQPYMVALMTQLLGLEGDEAVLEIGTGCGYQTAVLAEVAGSVYTVELEPRLSERAQETLAGLGYQGIRFRVGDGYQGWPEYAPYDGIVVTCAPERVPPPLQEQLAEGGRLVIPVGNRHPQQLYLIRRRGERLDQRSIIPCLFVPLVHRDSNRDNGQSPPRA